MFFHFIFNAAGGLLITFWRRRQKKWYYCGQYCGIATPKYGITCPPPPLHTHARTHARTHTHSFSILTTKCPTLPHIPPPLPALRTRAALGVPLAASPADDAALLPGVITPPPLPDPGPDPGVLLPLGLPCLRPMGTLRWLGPVGVTGWGVGGGALGDLGGKGVVGLLLPSGVPGDPASDGAATWTGGGEGGRGGGAGEGA